MNSLAGSPARRAFSLGSALLLTMTMSVGAIAQDPSSTPTANHALAEASPPADVAMSDASGLTLGPWRLATIDELDEGYLMAGVVSSELGTIAHGGRDYDGAPGPAFWTSKDDATFERATVARNAREGVIEGAVAGPDGWVAVGRSFPERAHAWFSRDGRHWKAAKVDSAKGHVLYDVASTPIGLVAVGAEAEFHARVGKAWVSEDGRSWKLLSKLPIQLPYSVEVIGDRIVVAGFSNGFESERSNAVTASSKNGKKWKLDDLYGPDASGYNSLASREDELFATGYRLGNLPPDDSALLSHSTNGRDWAPLEPAEFHGWSGTGIAANDDLVLVVGQGNFDDVIAPVSQSSSDLEAWQPGTFVEGLRAEGYGIADVTFTHAGDRALMAGQVGDTPAIWVADVAAVGTPEAEPAPVGPLGPIAPERFAVAVTPEGPEGASIHDVISGGPGYIAVGGGSVDGTAPEALVWTSPDGLNWEAATLSDGANRGVVEAVSALSGGGYLAVGNDASAGEALAWHSDDGSGWDLVPPHESFAASVFRDVTASVEGATIVGASAFPDASAGQVWSSADGRSWDAPAALGLTPLAVASRGVTLAIAGVDDAGRADGGQAILAVTGAEGWATTELLGDPASNLVDIATTDDGYVAAGWQRRPGKKVESALFLSSDGISWDPVTHKRLKGMRAAGVGLNDDGVLLVGTKNGEPIGFWTRDLEEFETIRFPKETVLEDLRIDGGSITADGLMAFALGSEAGRPAIWFSAVE